MVSFMLTPKEYYFCPGAIVRQDILETSGNASKDQAYSETGKFVPSKKVLELKSKLIKFMEDHIYPMENEFNKLAQSSSRWTVHPEEERLKELAKKAGLWNLWIPVCFSILPLIHTVFIFYFLLFCFLFQFALTHSYLFLCM